MLVSDLKRVIKYKKVELEDFPGLPIEEVIKMHSGEYPEIIGATFEYKGIENDIEIYELKETAGTKG